MKSKKQFLRCTLIIGALAMFLICSPDTVFGQVNIAALKNSNLVSGCTCVFQTAAEAKKRNSQKYLFLSELGTREGWMNIDGKDTRLKLVKSTENTNIRRRARVGNRFYEEYRAAGIKVRIDYVTRWVCPPRDEGCEATDYNVTITINKGKSTQTLKATGACGC
jgi:hypothetical protein